MSAIDTLKNRVRINSDNFYTHSTAGSALATVAKRLQVRGGPDQWVRMREDKLRSLKKALLYSYQSAVVQRYDVKKNSKANNIIQLITRLQDVIELNDNEKEFLTDLEREHMIELERGSSEYIDRLK